MALNALRCKHLTPFGLKGLNELNEQAIRVNTNNSFQQLIRQYANECALCTLVHCGCEFDFAINLSQNACLLRGLQFQHK